MARGLLDWPGVLLGLIDQPLTAVLPAPLALAFWALVSAWLSMWVYRRFSNQDEMAALKPQVKAVQNKLSKYDGEFSGLMPLIRENFRLSGKQIMLALGPALLAGVPVLFVLVWISNAYGVTMPPAGAQIEVRAIVSASVAAGAGVDADASDWRWRGTEAEPLPSTNEAGHAWSIAWPQPQAGASLVTANGDKIIDLPLARPAPVVHQRKWWNALIGNPAGYLDDDSPAEAVYLDLPKQQMLPFGPGWMRGWEFLYFLLLVAGSLGLKFIWRIH